MGKRLFTLLLGGAVLLGLNAFSRPAAAEPRLVYRNDFQGVVGPEFSNFATDTTPAGNRRFLGQFNNNTVTLQLTNLPKHNEVTVTFDLYVINSWDGNSVEPNAGPDTWTLDASPETALFKTTFSNTETPQAYPEPFPGGSNPARSGSVESNSLGYPEGDTVYHLTYTFRHTRQGLMLNFTGAGLQPGVEAWGLDNVSVSVDSTKAGKLRLSPKRLKFKNTGVGNTRTREVRLVNKSKGPLVGNVGFLQPPFRVVSGSGSFSLPPRGRLNIVVEFAPTAAGPYNDTLVITSDDPKNTNVSIRVGGRSR